MIELRYYQHQDWECVKNKESQMTVEVKSLAQAILDEQARCRDLHAEYISIGPPGYFGATMIFNALKRTEQAVMAGDTAEMLRCYEELKGIE